MLREDKYFDEYSEDQLWQRYCGFLDLSVNEFMDIQKELLLDQIERVADSVLGKKVMGGSRPKTIDEFRKIVPLTTYDDYEPYLSDKREDALAAKPQWWCHSAGRGGRFKWVPQSKEVFERCVKGYLAAFILSTANNKGEVNIRPGFRLLATIAPAPYTSGYIMTALKQGITFKLIPPLEDVELSFHDRIKKGFKMALRDGVDIMGAVTSILARMGEEFSEQTSKMQFSISLLHPNIIFRLIRAVIRSKRNKRPILPKDLWNPKGIIASGLDTEIYKEAVTHYWGTAPHELYAGTEGLVYAMQSWNKKALTFLPDMVFFEFIPYEGLTENEEKHKSNVSTVLLNELEEGKLYEVILTQFYGMPLLRYCVDDIIKVVALKDEEVGTELPQFEFQRRVGEIINLAGLTQLDEKTIWRAIANTGVKYVDWSACKEYAQNKTYLRIYIELKEKMKLEVLEKVIDEQLRIVDIDYQDLDSYLGLQPVKVTVLTPGTFQAYIDEKVKEGADIAHLKPNRINAPDSIIQRLLELSKVAQRK